MGKIRLLHVDGYPVRLLPYHLIRAITDPLEPHRAFTGA